MKKLLAMMKKAGFDLTKEFEDEFKVQYDLDIEATENVAKAGLFTQDQVNERIKLAKTEAVKGYSARKDMMSKEDWDLKHEAKTERDDKISKAFKDGKGNEKYLDRFKASLGEFNDDEDFDKQLKEKTKAIFKDENNDFMIKSGSSFQEEGSSEVIENAEEVKANYTNEVLGMV